MSGCLKAGIMVLICTLLDGCFFPNPEHCQGLHCNPEVSQSQLDRFIQGKTSREDVLMTLGAPSGREENDQIFIYTWSRITGSWCIAVAPGAGTCKDVKATRYVVIEFTGDRFRRHTWIAPNYFLGGNPSGEVRALIAAWSDNEP